MSINFKKIINYGLDNIKPYVPGKSIAEVMRERGVTDLIKMASNENPLGASPRALEAMREKLAGVFQYPEVSSLELRQELAGRFGVESDQILVGNGADGVIYSLIMALIEDGDQVILPEITFPMYETVVRTMRGQIVFSGLKDLAIDLEDILAKITPRTKMIWICNPNNPTGLMIDEKSLTDFLARVPEEVLVVHDEVYFDFAGPDFPNTLPLLKKFANLFLVRSFSKVYGLAGIRVGYGIGPAQLISLLYRVRPPFEVSPLAQVAALGALEDEDFYRKTLELTACGKEYLYAELTKLGLTYTPSSTNFILVDLGREAMPLYEALLDAGIIVRPARSYSLPNHIRVTVGTPDQNQRFITALRSVLGL